MTADFKRIQRDHRCNQVVSRYVTITKMAGKFWGHCPFHEDTTPTNFRVYAADGVEWFYCAGCHEGGDCIDFVAAIERCTKAQAAERIVDDFLPAVGEFTPNPVSAAEASAWRPIIPVPVDAPPYKPELTYIPELGRLKNWSSAMSRLDPYHDAEGRLICWVISIRLAGNMEAAPTITYCAGPKGERKWAAKRMDPPWPLMGLDDLARYPKRHVLIHPNERSKVAHDENSPPSEFGGPAMIGVTWLGGPTAVKRVDWSPLAPRIGAGKINFFPQDNEDGRRAMKQVYEMLIEKAGTGIAR
jgi:hypothetical protein